jgi:carbon-monoxide dehydrogenase large subunit
MPHYECDHIETPPLFAALGARGAAEGAGTPLVATINAIADALAPLGVTLVEGHAAPHDIWNLVQQAKARVAAQAPGSAGSMPVPACLATIGETTN